jgi:hypothetical protein
MGARLRCPLVIRAAAMKRLNIKHRRDVLSETGATELAQQIKDYWDRRGYAIDITVESMNSRHKQPIYTLRSNLRNGLPLRRSKIAA